MGHLFRTLQRPIVAATVLALASVSTGFSYKISSINSSNTCSNPSQSHSSDSNSTQDSKFSAVSCILTSRLVNLSFVTRIRVAVPKINFPVPNWSHNVLLNSLGPSVALSSVLLDLHQSAYLAKGPKPIAFTNTTLSSPPDVLYSWHLPEPSTINVSCSSDCSLTKSRIVVVLLGWLGSRQKHLKKYAEWYTSRGFHAITFTFPMTEILSYRAGGKADKEVELLVNHLAEWLELEDGKNLVFHTFSNTGWLTYGAILEKFQKQDPSLMRRIRGCIVDSAPVAAPDPQVWASGFSAALLKKHSVATKIHTNSNESDTDVLAGSKIVDPKPHITEAALLIILEKFFEVVLNLPVVNRRLCDVLSILAWGQPRCPQLYIYSSADRVIPSRAVESFIEQQRRAGHDVRSCNFVSTPHVDHFRNDPKLYTHQLSQFFDDSVLTCCKGS